MCRLFIYKGKIECIKNLIWLPWNSLLKQSFKEPYTPQVNNNPRDHPLNVDGFGISLYIKDKKKPCLYTNIIPPWNDRNLLKLSNFLEAGCFFAHIRGIKPFSNNTFCHQYNCHPFCYNKISWMHNGDIQEHNLLKKYVYKNLPDKLLNNIKGNTDSEYAFHIFLNELLETNFNEKMNIWQKALKKTINIIDEMTSYTSTMNFCVTNGKYIICSRYINNNNETPPSLYMCIGEEYILENKNTYMRDFDKESDENDNKKCVIIASEPIDCYEKNWQLIPKNTMLSIDNNFNIEYLKL